MTSKQITLQSTKPIDPKVLESLSVLLSKLGIKIVISDTDTKTKLSPKKEQIMQETLKIFELDEDDQDDKNYNKDKVKPLTIK